MSTKERHVSKKYVKRKFGTVGLFLTLYALFVLIVPYFFHMYLKMTDPERQSALLRDLSHHRSVRNTDTVLSDAPLLQSHAQEDESQHQCDIHRSVRTDHRLFHAVHPADLCIQHPVFLPGHGRKTDVEHRPFLQ